MKKFLSLILVIIIALSLAACGENETPVNTEPDPTADSLDTPQTPEPEPSEESSPDDMPSNDHVPEKINASTDKYTWYIKDYVGKNCAAIGYTSMGGDRMDSYGGGYIQLVLVKDDGSYVDIEDEEVLKGYYVVGQNIKPNSELKLTFLKDENGDEYDNLTDSQSYDEIVLSIKEVGDKSKSQVPLTEINSAPDKYTRYIVSYIGRNLANCGYISMGGDLRGSYGSANVKFVITTDDGSYIDPTDKETLKKYVVTGQNIDPNTELNLVFAKESDGTEYDNLVESQNIEEIELYVKAVG